MSKILALILLCGIVVACAPKKPPIAETQMVNGKCIIVPPEFDKKPK